MKSSPECTRCFLRQAGDAARLAGVAHPEREAMLATIGRELALTPQGQNPAITASSMHARIRQLSDNPDPYREKKREATAHALALYSHLKALLAEAADPLATAVRLAIAGNIIDLGVADEYDLEASIERVLALPPAIDHMEHLRCAIDKAEKILYLADNAGETVLDRLLIECLGKPVTYVVKGGPAVNDATREDAREAGLEGVCAIIDNGAAAMGTLLDQCSAAFRRHFDAADLILAKGIANYESLVGSRANLFFLLQAKCAVVAADLGVAEKSVVILENR